LFSAFIYGRFRVIREAHNTIAPHSAPSAITPAAGVPGATLMKSGFDSVLAVPVTGVTVSETVNDPFDV